MVNKKANTKYNNNLCFHLKCQGYCIDFQMNYKQIYFSP